MGTDHRALRLKVPGSEIPLPKTSASLELAHPCLRCGACCATFRVGFYLREANVEENENAVPIELTEDVSPNLRCMKGTNVHHGNKCVALVGKIGEHAVCSIYKNRSSTCRNFKASYEDGVKNPRCDQARAKHGLKPLTKDDYRPRVPGSEIPPFSEKQT